MALEQIFKRVKAASKPLALMEDERRNEILRLVARAIIERQDEILAANAHDLSRMDAANPMYDRLQLTPSRLQSIAADMCNVASLPSPLGRVLRHRVLDNGLELRRVSVPYGVIGMIYEARPNVTFDVFSLCFKSGNACVLKGGRDADETNRAETALIHDVLRRQGVDTAIVELLPATHEATAEMLSAVGYIDLCIPRGGKQLIDFVRNTARIPVIETGAGWCTATSTLPATRLWAAASSRMPRRDGAVFATRSIRCSSTAAGWPTYRHSAARSPTTA